MAKIIGSAALTPGGDSGTDLTTKGDLHGYSSSNTRIPVGSNDTVLTADSSEALGVKWAAVSGGANTALSNLSSVAVNATIDMNTNTIENIKWNALKAQADLTISTGEVTGTQSNIRVDSEGSASTDDFNSFTGFTPGTLTWHRQANDARDITWVNDSTPGSNRFTCGSNVTFTSRFDTISFLQYAANGTGNTWLCIASRDNG